MKESAEALERFRKILRPLMPQSLRRLLLNTMAWFASGDLASLARIYDSDKWGGHWYAKHYERHFGARRRKPVKLLEIGIGGYDRPTSGGGSLRMWRTYFPKGRIYGIDIYDKTAHDEDRIRTYRGDQTSADFLRRVNAEIGAPDIVIDDGSHRNEHVIKTFQILFPLLAENGIYVVEDTQTSYWPEYGGRSDQLDGASTSMFFLKKLTDGLNHEEFILPGYTPSYFDQNIVSMHFYHNLVFIYKGSNNEGSVEIRQNMPPGQGASAGRP